MAAADRSVRSLIARARNSEAPEAERHEAFGELVRRFQDFVFAYCCARLRDPALAEDATQDTFVSAWAGLDQLRDPAAFPGWIRQLARTQCHRRVRGTRLALVSEDLAHDITANTDVAAECAEQHDFSLVHRALAALSPSDRLVLILFYGSERSHADIAAWLQVPVSTIARRLAHARRRLRQKTLAAFAGAFRAERLHRSRYRPLELAARLRPLTGEDRPDVAALSSRLGLDDVPVGRSDAPRLAYIVEDPSTRAPMAYAAAVPTIFAPIYDLHLAIGPDALRRHAGDVLLSQILSDLAGRKAITLQFHTAARHAAIVAFLTSRGFQIAGRAEDWRLSKRAPASEVAVPIGSRLTFAGVEVLREDRTLFHEALEMLSAALGEEPSARYLLPVHADTLTRLLRTQTDGVLAIDDGRLAGVLTASPDPLLTGTRRIRLLLVHESLRRRRIATSLLARLRSATGQTSCRLVAAPSPAVTGWLVHNGFRQADDRLMLERLLRPSVSVPVDRLNEYVGSYVADAIPDVPIVIERHGDSLVSKARDMRDVLLASSETEFFTRHHYGCGRFERDGTGRVSRLVYTDGPREIVAVRVDPITPA
jgi:RNA polymerase sigma-70 factor (ECF subfamily)